MSDAPPSPAADASPRARLEALPFRAFLGIGAGLGVLGLVLAWLTGPSANPATTSPTTSPKVVTGDVTSPKVVAGGDDATGQDDATGPDTTGPKVVSAGAQGAAATDGDAPGTAGAQDDDGANADDASDGADTADTAGPDDGTYGEASGDGSATTDPGTDPVDDVIVEDDTAPSERSSTKSSTKPTSDPTGEAAMTAEELLEAAKTALAEKRYRDAYRLATRSQYKKKSNDTLTVKAKAACGNKDEAAAKDAMKSLPTLDDRRKEIRSYCRDRGIRLGL